MIQQIKPVFFICEEDLHGDCNPSGSDDDQAAYFFGKSGKEVGITDANLSKIKNNKVHSIRFSILTELCKALDCQPSDLLEYIDSEESDSK